MMFAHDIVICEKSKEKAEASLEKWRTALESRGMKISRAKTEYLRMNGTTDGDTIEMQGAPLARVTEFKYLEATVQEDGNCGREVKN